MLFDRPTRSLAVLGANKKQINSMINAIMMNMAILAPCSSTKPLKTVSGDNNNFTAISMADIVAHAPGEVCAVVVASSNASQAGRSTR